MLSEKDEGIKQYILVGSFRIDTEVQVAVSNAKITGMGPGGGWGSKGDYFVEYMVF